MVVFATVVKQLYEDDPVLANGIWRKAVPKGIDPPWHYDVGEERGDGGEEGR